MSRPGDREPTVRLSAQYLLVWVDHREDGDVVVVDDRGTQVEFVVVDAPPERAAMGCMRVVTALESFTNDLIRRAHHPVTGPNVAVIGQPDPGEP